MRTPTHIYGDAMIAGNLAGACSLAALMIRSRLETGHAVNAINAPAHWIFGDRALRAKDWSIRYTLTGLLIHQASAVFWGLCHQVHDPQSERLVRNALVTTAIASFVDLAMTPRRLTPGFERRLSPRGLAWVYGAFAAGMAIGSMLNQRR